MPDSKASAADDAAPLNDALRNVLTPLARLAVARGVPFTMVEALLKQAFVDAARSVHGASGQPNRMVSRIATATGLTRREVTRLTQPAAPTAKAAPRRSLASEVFARWMSDPTYRTRKGPKALPRIGAAPSFEALAQSVTRDVHPRSMLDELIRLGLAAHDETSDRVTLVRETFVPRGNVERMMSLLGANVGDHLAGAVDNVLGDGSRHFEQALFADGLPPDAMLRLREVVLAQWKDLRASIVPALEAMLDAERQAGRDDGARVRIGLYTFTDAPASEPTPPAKARPRRIRFRE